MEHPETSLKRKADELPSSEPEQDAKRQRVDDDFALESQFRATNAAALAALKEIESLKGEMPVLLAPKISRAWCNYDVPGTVRDHSLWVELGQASVNMPELGVEIGKYTFPMLAADIPHGHRYMDASRSWPLCTTREQRTSLVSYTEEASNLLGYAIEQYHTRVRLVQTVKDRYQLTELDSHKPFWFGLGRAVPMSFHIGPMTHLLMDQEAIAATLMAMSPLFINRQ